jgi:signal transduction histidine kinase
MDIVDYDIIENESSKSQKFLIFLKVVDSTNETAKLTYKTLNNIIYEVSDGFCITDRRGTPLVIRKDLEQCEEYLNEEYMKNHNVVKKLVLNTNVT